MNNSKLESNCCYTSSATYLLRAALFTLMFYKLFKQMHIGLFTSLLVKVEAHTYI
jgi:hypothetical protein